MREDRRIERVKLLVEAAFDIMPKVHDLLWIVEHAVVGSLRLEARGRRERRRTVLHHLPQYAA